MDSNKIKVIIVILLSAFGALYLGVAAATAQIEALAWVGGGVFLAVCLFLGKNVWILIPASLGMKGELNFLPGTPTPWHLMTIVVGVFFFIRFAVRRQSLSFKWTWLETTLLLVALTIGQAFVRNPTGLSMMGGDVAGGKPYFIFALAFAAYALLMLSDASITTWKWAVGLYIGVSLLDGLVNAASSMSPALAGVLIRFYSNVSFDVAMGIKTDFSMTGNRIKEFGAIGSVLGLIACTFWRPMAAVDFRRPWQFLIALTGAGLVLLSGFRTSIGSLFVNYILGSALRRKWGDIFVTVILGSFILVGLIAGGFTRSMPYGFQRSLSFLPIEVDSDVEMAARGSSETRFDMWRLVLTTDRYISNKLLGDGFNISARELKAREDWKFGDVRMRQQMTWMEQTLEMGSYHGFHAETIRFTGAVGLLAATLALFALAVLAFRMITAFRNTPHWGFVMFICMPFVIKPLWYWLVFGSYRSGFPLAIAMAGMIKLLAGIQQRMEHSPTVPLLNHSKQ